MAPAVDPARRIKKLRRQHLRVRPSTSHNLWDLTFSPSVFILRGCRMSLLDQLSDEAVWNRFYEYKCSLACPKQFTKELRFFIDEKRYLPICEKIRSGQDFPLPEKAVISKMGSEKRRTVYSYPDDESTVLKLLTYLILRKYDGIFQKSLYSFRPGRTAKDAVKALLGKKLIEKKPDEEKQISSIFEMYAYKADIHDYFNSIPVESLLPILRETLAEDEELFDFLTSLLKEENVRFRGQVIREKKGIMAGTPQSAFYANLFLKGLDEHFAEQGVIYARYSDDIILFAPTEDEVRTHAAFIHSYLEKYDLSINPSKENFYSPGEGFTFLGFSCKENIVDIAPATVKKLKQKMKRKRDALKRWSDRNDVAKEKAAAAFIRIFNRKLLESPQDNELSWSHWFFPVINTTDSLHAIDLYAQDCLRYLISGTHTKARYNVTYEMLKKLGYRSLVNAYYKDEENVE